MTVRTFVIGELCVSPYNVRTDGRAIGALEQLKSSLLKRGLLMPLVVHPLKGNAKKFGAIAGGRRYRALKALIEDGKLPADYPIDAVVREGMTEAELIELSTAENVVRRDLYAYETFYALARARRRGSSFEEIAETLGQDVDWVKKGARLGMLAEPIFKAFAEEKISLEAARAFAATEDTKLQLAVYEAFQQQPRHQQTPAMIRSLMKVGDSELTRLLHYVGEQVYRCEGGRFELDLFADSGDDRGVVLDEGLLRELANAKLDRLRATIRARAGREQLRFAPSPPENDFGQDDRSLLITPPAQPLSAEDEQRLAELGEDQARLEDASWQYRDRRTGRMLPGCEEAIATINAVYDPNDAEIEAIENKRPIVLPVGDVIATIDIDDSGFADVRFWWSSRKAYAAATAPAPKKASTKSSPDQQVRQPGNSHASAKVDDKPIADGAAIIRSNLNDWSARERADRRLKDAYGLTAEGVQTARTLRRAMLRHALLQDDADGGTVAQEYLAWGQLRMLLTQSGPSQVGMRRITPLDTVELRDDRTGSELLDQATAGLFEETRERVAKYLCFTLPDLQIAFANYRAMSGDMKAEATALLACLVLERSLEADGYRVPMHDLVALETGMAGDAELRELGAFTPTAPLFNLFSKDHRLELAIPFVGRDAVASWAKKKTGEQNTLLERVFTGTSNDLLDGVDDRAAAWIHPLLSFEPPKNGVTLAIVRQEVAK